jgi:hypothetical protein
MPADRDPFDGLRLDERFVRGARFIEPPATDRRPDGDAQRGAPVQVSPAPRGLPGFFHRLVAPPTPAPRGRRAARLVATVALAVGMVSLAVVLLRQNATRVQPGTEPSSVVAGPTVELTAAASASQSESASRVTPGADAGTGAGSGAGVPGTSLTGDRQTAPGVVVPAAVMPSLDRGVCLTWTTAAGPVATGVGVVDCSAPHRAEVTGIVALADRFPAWPGRGALDGVVEQACPAALDEHMVTDPRGLLAQPGGAYPAQAEWAGEARALVCLVVDQVSGVWSGSVQAADQIT